MMDIYKATVRHRAQIYEISRNEKTKNIFWTPPRSKVFQLNVQTASLLSNVGKSWELQIASLISNGLDDPLWARPVNLTY